MYNRVIGRGEAMVDGKRCALAGCNNHECPRSCIRKHELLVFERDNHFKAEPGGNCKHFIPSKKYFCFNEEER